MLLHGKAKHHIADLHSLKVQFNSCLDQIRQLTWMKTSPEVEIKHQWINN